MSNRSGNPPPEAVSDVVVFIERARDRGASDEFVAQMLKQFGWPQREIERAFFEVYERLTGYPIPAPPASGTESAKDAFFYLLSFSMLGTWAQALGQIAFIYINQAIPDATQNSYGNSDYDIAFALARLIVAYPVYLLIMRLINQELRRYREKHFSGVRKWLTYFTLLVVSIIGVCTLIAFLTSFLRGELTTRFVVKALVVLLIDGGVLVYYLKWLTRSPSRLAPALRPANVGDRT